MGVISAAPRLNTERYHRLIGLCYDLQENGWLPGDARLYKRGIWNGRAKGRRFEAFARLWRKAGPAYQFSPGSETPSFRTALQGLPPLCKV